MGDKWINDCLTMYIKTDVASRIDCENIMQQFQNTKHHRSNCKTLCIKVLFFVMLIYLIYLLFKILYNLHFLLNLLENIPRPAIASLISSPFSSLNCNQTKCYSLL